MGDEKKYQPPKPTAADTAHTLTRAGLELIPVVGTAAAELFRLVIVPPLEKRHARWTEEMAEGLRRLESEGRLNLEDLAKNEVFIDTVLAAWNAAIRTSQEEKREALRNAVLNSALPNPPDAARQQMFVNLVDTLTVWHLRILRLFNDPFQWFKERGQPNAECRGIQTYEQLLLRVFPELEAQPDLRERVTKDLYNHGLFGTQSDYDRMGTDVVDNESQRTKWGQQFLAFVTAPS